MKNMKFAIKNMKFAMKNMKFSIKKNQINLIDIFCWLILCCYLIEKILCTWNRSMPGWNSGILFTEPHGITSDQDVKSVE